MNRATKKNNVYVVVSAMFLLLQTGADVVFFELLTHRIRCIHQFESFYDWPKKNFFYLTGRYPHVEASV